MHARWLSTSAMEARRGNTTAETHIGMFKLSSVSCAYVYTDEIMVSRSLCLLFELTIV